MALTDSLKDFWIKKILMPKVFRIDQPGYVTGKFYTLEGQEVFVRNMFMPETFFLLLEEEVKKELGDNGLLKLYGAAKKFGYNFAALNKLPKANPGLAIDLVTRFLESLYAENLEAVIDIKSRYVELKTDGLFITRINGSGVSLTVGGYAGVCAYIFNDFNNIECGVLKVADNYELICGDNKLLKDKKIDHFEFKEAPREFDQRYMQLNAPQKVNRTDAFSLNKLMETGLFSYEKGSLKFSLSDMRFAPVEISLIYMIEQSIGQQIVYLTSKKVFTQIGQTIKKQNNPYLFLSNLLTALGFGIVELEITTGIKIFNFSGFPWFYEGETSNFPFCKGAIEGFLIGQNGENINTNITKGTVVDGRLLVSVSVIV